jgi:pilus assembly protein Flp/PilA
MMKLFLRDESGATVIEYALIAGLISIVIIVGVNLWSDEVVEMFQEIQVAVAG